MDGGFLPPHTVNKLGRDTVRNLMGFKDGTATLDARDEALMNRVVWAAATDEPAWAADRSYQPVRLIRMMVERWDGTPFQEQESIFGRDKAVGAPVGLKNEHDIPSFQDDDNGTRVPIDAHIRRANPRTRSTEANLILRRSYNYSRGLTHAGQLDMGLLFVAFQADLSAGFLTAGTSQRRGAGGIYQTLRRRLLLRAAGRDGGSFFGRKPAEISPSGLMPSLYSLPVDRNEKP